MKILLIALLPCFLVACKNDDTRPIMNERFKLGEAHLLVDADGHSYSITRESGNFYSVNPIPDTKDE